MRISAIRVKGRLIDKFVFKDSIFQIFGSLVAEMRIVQAEIIIFHFPVGKFALAGGEFFPKGADIAAVLQPGEVGWCGRKSGKNSFS